ncbi:MAG: formate dehydrogenase subunit gamma [Deltaproteobacteria bacterium]
MTTLTKNRLNGYLIWGAALLIFLGCALYLQANGADPANPRANFWRVVRDGVPGYTAMPEQGHSILIQNGGENWREIRDILIIGISPWVLGLAPWVLGVALAAMGLFYLLVGGEKLRESRSGVMITRFTLGERLMHWYTALLFIVMAVTGLSILLGRSALIPFFGHGAVASYLSVSKVLHNWCGPLFLAGIFLEFVIWVRHNIPREIDLQWFRSMGGMFGSGPPPHSGKINGGEKVWFWLIFFFGSAVGITGVLLDFPIWWEQTRFTMQVSEVIHATVAVLFVTASFGHIYMGTLGSEGAFEGMWRGKVDEVWAKQHADLWYAEKMAEENKIQPEPANPGNTL